MAGVSFVIDVGMRGLENAAFPIQVRYARSICMKFTAEEFLAFASAAQSRKWETSPQRKPYTYSVEASGIRVTPSTGTSRLISNAKVRLFCEVHDYTEERMKELKGEFHNSYLRPIARAYDSSFSEFSFPEEIKGEIKEGAVRLVLINAHERSTEARRLCIAKHGVNCAVCGFSFEAVYGPSTSGFIHVHHLSPVALQGDEYTVDPVADLRPVCPNCHAVIHMGGGCLSIEEAKALLCRRT